jgi:hypothetical protein
MKMQVEHIRLLATNGVDVSLGDYDDRYLYLFTHPRPHNLLPTTLSCTLAPPQPTKGGHADTT